MKSYPYIYSLSTVGLIHHYNNDYLFNRVRTDFTGDSGTGKSMIADLLQLIFVGSAEFEAATESIDEKRRPKGMVLTDRKRGLSGKGYAFLNIALDLGQYLVIGMYLEHSTNGARPFIIHQGYDTENPEFLKKPLSHNTFLDLQNILSVEDLKKNLVLKQLNCEVMSLSSYHRFLYRQQILPIDLADNPAKLKAYALIIQSFSRGKGFKFDTKNLQDFLFGTTDEKNIMTVYQQQIENLNTNMVDSLNYKKQIEELTAKKSALQDLIKRDRQRTEMTKTFLESKYQYITKRYNDNLQSLQEQTPLLINATYEAVLLHRSDLLNQQSNKVQLLKTVTDYQMEKNGETSLEKWAEEAMELLLEEKDRKKKSELLGTVAKDLGLAPEEIRARYNQQQINGTERKTITEFVKQLLEKEILKAFDDSIWKSDYTKALLNHESKLEEFETAIKTNIALMKFSNVNAPHSIAHWAINITKALSHEQESVLVRYKDLIVDNPSKKEDRYLPDPASFFETLNIDEDLRDNAGFWISLNGVYEYIQLVDERFLDSNEPQVKKDYFAAKHAKSAIELNTAQNDKKLLLDFHRELHSISGLADNLALYQRKDEIESYIVIPALEVDRQSFKVMMECYEQSESIDKAFAAAEKKWKVADERVRAFKNSYSTLSKIADIKGYESNLQQNLKIIEQQQQWNERKQLRLVRLLPEVEAEHIKTQNEALLRQNSLAITFSTVAAKQATLLVKRKELRDELRKLNLQNMSLQAELQDNGLLTPTETGERLFTEIEIEQLRNTVESATAGYKVAVDNLVQNFLADDSYRYADEENWKKIARGLLPELFKSDDISEEQLSSEVEEKLQNIIDKNRVIGDRKVQMLLEVFGKVETSFTNFSTEIDRMKVFFNGNDKRITGGHKVVIKADPSTEYPIRWITDFKKRLRDENTDRTGLFKIADDAIDFKDIIVQSFRQCGGKKSDPKIEDLLNPKKYFELSFSLQKDNIKSSGSTGQVYTAIALLCIARISLIEQEEGSKKRRGVRFMPVDEAEGLGSNYEMLSNIAKSEDYQIISMSINPVGEFEKGNHYIYMLNEPEDEEIRINGVPFAQFTEDGLASDIKDFTMNQYNG